METTPEGRMRKRKNSICLSTTESTGKRERINLRRPVYLIKRRRGNLVDFLCVDVATRIGIVVTFNSISTDPSSSSDRGGKLFQSCTLVCWRCFANVRHRVANGGHVVGSLSTHSTSDRHRSVTFFFTRPFSRSIESDIAVSLSPNFWSHLAVNQKPTWTPIVVDSVGISWLYCCRLFFSHELSEREKNDCCGQS